MSNEIKNENKDTKADAKADAAKATKYTPLAFRRAVEVLDDAADTGFFDECLAERVREEAEVFESEDCPGTWFVSWHAKTWREAAAFSAAVIGAAFASGLYAEATGGWKMGFSAKDGGRIVDVFVASTDFMTDDGKPVVVAAESEEGAQ